MLTIFINGDGGTFEVALVFPLAPLLWCLQIEEFKVLIANLILWYIGNWYIISDESSGSVFNSMYKTITEFYTSLIYSRKFLLSYGARDFFPDEWWIKVFSDELAFFFFLTQVTFKGSLIILLWIFHADPNILDALETYSGISKIIRFII